MNYIKYMSGGGSTEGAYTTITNLIEKTGIPSSMKKTNHQIIKAVYDALQKFKVANVKNTPVVTSGNESDNDSNLLDVYRSEQPVQHYSFTGTSISSGPRLYWTSNNQ